MIVILNSGTVPNLKVFWTDTFETKASARSFQESIQTRLEEKPPPPESYYGPRNKRVHPPGDVNISSSPLLQIIAEWVIQFSRRRALPVANLFSITSEERLVKLTRHIGSAGRRQSEATSNNHSCMVVNEKLGKLCPVVADRRAANKH